MDYRHLFCCCGSTKCICEDGCQCSDEKCICSTCKVLLKQAICEGCGHGRRERRTREESESSQASNYARESEVDELIFQMDDIDEPPKVSVPKPVSKLGSRLGSFQSHFNTVSNLRQSRLSEEKRIEQNRSTNVLKSKDSALEISSEINPNVIALIPEESQVHVTSIIQNPSESSKLNPIEITLNLDETQAAEISIIQDRRRSFVLNPRENLSKPLELSVTKNVSVAESSPSSVYSDIFLPSYLSSDDEDSDSESTHSAVKSSPTKLYSTSAPAMFDVPEPIRQSKHLKQTSDIQTSSGAQTSSNLPGIETLMISDSRTAVTEASELNSSVETNSTSMNPESITKGNPNLPQITITPSLFATSSTTELSTTKSPSNRDTEDSLKLSSPEFSKYDRKRTSSESSSSIETLSTEPAIENLKDESSKNFSQE